MNGINRRILFWLNDIPPHSPYPARLISKKRSLSVGGVLPSPPHSPESGPEEMPPVTPVAKKRKTMGHVPSLARRGQVEDDDEENEQTPRAEPSLSDDRASQRTGSTGASGTSSPTKALRALKYQEDGLDHVKLDVSDDTLPASLVELANDMQEIGNGEGVVPVYLKGEINDLGEKTTAHGRFKPYRFDDDKERYPQPLHRQLKLGDVLQVVSDARDCDEYQADETYWNNHVHTSLLNIIFRGTNPCPTQLDGFKSCTTASILPEYKINATAGKKVDYASFINPEQDTLLLNATKLIDEICASATDNSINHTSFQRLLDRPISFSIETKRGAQMAQKAELQMGV
ncbi:uncharacterized protein FSUBG_11845 [Fusarium subglutinans]|uniref:PD-(D/E)XK nuclease-like domain-containing protein n=1 Tax=Gibberella subglutinans TaxID=42677 RepID=A0A8H5P5I4_GIBSU|nr:uncharacterized protein FSUBG_11845 [Fusarium subglutinans]KAF5587305.1 hypothetical protein FSUBG_11845 [Fusarium subglutinans]